MMTTYKNRASITFVCDECSKPIYPGETLVTAYFDKGGENINVLEASKKNLKNVIDRTYHESCAPN